MLLKKCDALQSRPENGLLLETLDLSRRLFLALVAWANAGLAGEASTGSPEASRGSGTGAGSCSEEDSSQSQAASGSFAAAQPGQGRIKEHLASCNSKDDKAKRR